MSWLGPLLVLLQGVLDRLPSRKEALLNQIQDSKNEIKKLQTKTSAWTAVDSGLYYTLTDKLSKLEERAKNI